MATLPMATAPAFFSAGVTQLRSTHLTAEDYQNAFGSLVAQDPATPPSTAAAVAATTNSNLAYFGVDSNGQPMLIVPPGSPSFNPNPSPGPVPFVGTPTYAGGVQQAAPASGAVTVPAGTPCPEGFLPSGASVGSQVGTAFEQLPATWATEPSSPTECQPSFGVEVEAQLITPDDCLQVIVYTYVVTTGLVLNGRILDCNGAMHYMQESLDGVATNTVTTITVPLTPGYLLDVGVSDPGGVQTSGSTFVSVGLQHTCQAGQGATGFLAQGYVTGTWGVSWPGNQNGAPVSAPVFRPAPGSVALIQSRAALTNSGYTVSAALNQSVTAGDTLVLMTVNQALSLPVTVSDTQSNAWSLAVRTTYYDIWVAKNCAAGFTTVTYAMNPPYTFSLQMHVFELAGIDLTNPVDVTATAAGSSNVTATTSNTNYADVGVFLYGGLFTGDSSSGIPAGWQRILDTSTSDTRRLVSLCNLNKSTPPATWSFTTYLPGSNITVALAALHVAGG